jgi:excisionase family DNA binding protein
MPFRAYESGDSLTEAGSSSTLVPRLLSVADAARYLGRTEKSIRHLVQRRKLSSIRGDGRVMFDRGDLDAWIQRNRA